MDDDDQRVEATDAAMVIDALDLRAHPEGGWFRETFRDQTDGATVRSTAIYYLLGRGERSHWHRVTNAAEVWHHYDGDALRLSISADGTDLEEHVLGTDLTRGERPQVVVPTGHWQSAESIGSWTLVGCTVAPGFDFDAFELASPGWQPGPRGSTID